MQFVPQDVPVYRCATPEPITCLASACDGSLLVGGGASGKLYCWDVPTGELTRTWQGHYKAVTCLSISQCCQYIVSGGQDCAVHCWDAQSIVDAAVIADPDPSRQQPQPIGTWTGHALPVTQVLFASSGPLGSGMRILSSSLDRSIRCWDVPSRRCLLNVSLPAAVACLATSHDARFAFAGCVDGNTYQVDLHQEATAVAAQFAQRYAASSAAASSSSSLPFGGGAGAGSAAASAASSNGPAGSFGGSSSSSASSSTTVPHTIFRGHNATVTTVCCTADGLCLVTGGDDGSVRVHDIASGQQTGSYEGHRGSPLATVTVLPRPQHLLLAGKHAALPLTPIAPLRKHVVPMPLEWRGITTGPTGRERDVVARVHARAGGDADAVMEQRSINAALLQSVAVLQVVAGVVAASSPFTTQPPSSASAPAPSGTSGTAGCEAGDADVAALQARIAALEGDNARWKAVNNKLVQQLQATGTLPAQKG